MYTELIDLIKTFPGQKIEWQDKLRVKLSPHTEPVDMYGVKVFHKNEVCFYLGNGSWIHISFVDKAYYDKIAGSLLQRLKLIKHEASQTKGQDHPSTILT